MTYTLQSSPMTLKSAIMDAGKVSLGNRKMPGSTFAISAKRCNVGGKLAQVEGSTCSRCYALKLQKLRPSVDQGWEANYLRAVTMIDLDPERWAKAAAFQVERAYAKSGQPFHRWFDSGDLQSVAMLRAIVRVCELTPAIRHWLPTREAKVVKDYLAAHGEFPSNLVVRVSATMIGDKPIASHANTSTVHRKGTEHAGHACPASKQGNQCGECRACWDRDVSNVSYPLH
jgi:hypothetical protein